MTLNRQSTLCRSSLHLRDPTSSCDYRDFLAMEKKCIGKGPWALGAASAPLNQSQGSQINFPKSDPTKEAGMYRVLALALPPRIGVLTIQFMKFPSNRCCFFTLSSLHMIGPLDVQNNLEIQFNLILLISIDARTPLHLGWCKVLSINAPCIS